VTWRRTLAAIAAGLAASLSFPTPGFVPLAFVAWAPLLLALDGVTPARGAALGFTAGAVFFAVVLRWLAALTVPLWLASALYLALYVAAFGAIATRLWRGPRAALVALPAAWVALEWLRGWIFGGFPGAEIGSALALEPRLLSLASLGGVALLSLAVLSCNLAVALAARAAIAVTGTSDRHRCQSLVTDTGFAFARAGLVAVAIPALLVLHVRWVAPAFEERTGLSVVLIGGDTDPRVAERGDPFARAIQGYVAKTDRALEASAADLVLWPETSLPRPIEEGGLAIHARALRQRIDERWRAPLLFGVPVAASADAFWNEAQLWSGRDIAHYQKHRLVPFGEYGPELPFFGRLAKVLPGPDVAQGQGGEPFVVAGRKLGALICFEDLFSADVLERAEVSDALVILTNDVWLGEAGAAQHLGVAALRAVESGRWIARVANRGETAIIDPQGRVTPAALAPQKLPSAQGRTPYAAAPWLVPTLALAATLAALAASRRVTPSCE
jgi:apolipoprotein N-acyltransferase